MITLHIGRLDAASGYRNNVLIALFFQLIRFCSLNTQFQEPVVPTRVTFSFDSNRETTEQDVIAALSYVIFIAIIIGI